MDAEAVDIRIAGGCIWLFRAVAVHASFLTI